VAPGSGSHFDQSGKVVEFDAPRGLGVVESRDGWRLSFHCTQIADGSRSIKVGTDVTYALAPGALGTWEAVAVSPAS
jgi:cold shock CspA family protein